MKLNKELVKKILLLIESQGLYGSELFSSMKKGDPRLESAILYITLRSLKQHNIIEPYLSPQDNQCKVKVKYKLSEKGKKLLNSL